MPSSPPKTDPTLANLKTVNAERAEDYAEFLKYVAQSTGVISYAQLAILYPAICQAAMEWMLDKKKSVDFGFAILHPRPHRANWKQIMIALFPAMGPTLLGKSRYQKEALLTSSGFETKFLSGELLAIAAERYVVWGVEVETKRSWWKAMFRQEAAKLSALGSVNYAAQTARQIVNLRPRLVRAYLSFLRQVSYPCAKIKQSRPHGRGYIIPFVPRGRVRPVADKDVPVDVVVPRAPERVVAPKVAEVAPTNVAMPPLPDIQPENLDLRVAVGPEVAERPTNPDGMPLFHAGKKPTD